MNKGTLAEKADPKYLLYTCRLTSPTFLSSATISFDAMRVTASASSVDCIWSIFALLRDLPLVVSSVKVSKCGEGGASAVPIWLTADEVGMTDMSVFISSESKFEEGDLFDGPRPSIPNNSSCGSSVGDPSATIRPLSITIIRSNRLSRCR